MGDPATRYGIAASFNDPGGARTHDLLIKSQLLCQLSYRVAPNVMSRWVPREVSRGRADKTIHT